MRWDYTSGLWHLLWCYFWTTSIRLPWLLQALFSCYSQSTCLTLYFLHYVPHSGLVCISECLEHYTKAKASVTKLNACLAPLSLCKESIFFLVLKKKITQVLIGLNKNLEPDIRADAETSERERSSYRQFLPCQLHQKTGLNPVSSCLIFLSDNLYHFLSVCAYLQTSMIT